MKKKKIKPTLTSSLILKKTENIRNFFNSSLQYGHKTRQWNPKIAPYLWTQKNNQHIFSLAQTSKFLFRAGCFCKKIAKKNGKFLFVGTNAISSKLVPKIALDTNSFYINYRWIGGLLTNWLIIQKQILLYKKLLRDVSTHVYKSKQEKVFDQKKIDRLKKLFEGIKDMQKIPEAVIFTDQKKDYLAIQECIRLGVPTLCIVDTNCDPNLPCYAIPANDDSPVSVEYILNYLKLKIIAGYKIASLTQKKLFVENQSKKISRKPQKKNLGYRSKKTSSNSKKSYFQKNK